MHEYGQILNQSSAFPSYKNIHAGEKPHELVCGNVFTKDQWLGNIGAIPYSCCECSRAIRVHVLCENGDSTVKTNHVSACSRACIQASQFPRHQNICLRNHAKVMCVCVLMLLLKNQNWDIRKFILESYLRMEGMSKAFSSCVCTFWVMIEFMQDRNYTIILNMEITCKQRCVLRSHPRIHTSVMNI